MMETVIWNTYSLPYSLLIHSCWYESLIMRSSNLWSPHKMDIRILYFTFFFFGLFKFWHINLFFSKPVKAHATLRRPYFASSLINFFFINELSGDGGVFSFVFFIWHAYVHVPYYSDSFFSDQIIWMSCLNSLYFLSWRQDLNSTDISRQHNIIYLMIF